MSIMDNMDEKSRAGISALVDTCELFSHFDYLQILDLQANDQITGH